MDKYNKIFQIFSQQPKNTVNREIVHNLLRQAGYTITDQQNQKLLTKFKEEDVTFEQFIEVAESLDTNIINDESIMAAFKLFDYDNVGFINVGTLKIILQEDGNELDELEIEEIIRLADPDRDGRIDYAAFMKMMA